MNDQTPAETGNSEAPAALHEVLLDYLARIKRDRQTAVRRGDQIRIAALDRELDRVRLVREVSLPRAAPDDGPAARTVPDIEPCDDAAPAISESERQSIAAALDQARGALRGMLDATATLETSSEAASEALQWARSRARDARRAVDEIVRQLTRRA